MKSNWKAHFIFVVLMLAFVALTIVSGAVVRQLFMGN
jgi:hypothetical protein